MRINESFSAPISTGAPENTSGVNGNGSSSRTGSSSEDLVSLSNAADLISRTLSSDSSQRAARIQSLSAQVQAGTYNISADALSSSMIDRMMLGD